MDGISDEKLASLLNEGFSEDYIRSILVFKPSPKNPDLDLNQAAREVLGISYDAKSQRAGVSMTNHRVRVVGQRQRINPHGDKS